MAEWVVLDPEEVAEDRVELDITKFVNKDGIDWGDAAITAAMAEAQRGQMPIGFTVPNRQVTIPLLLYDRPGLEDDNANNFDAIRSAIQAKASRFQEEGGWIKRSVAGDPVYAEVVGATLKLGGGSAQAVSSIDPDAVLVLELIPDFFADEGELTEAPAASAASGEAVFLLEDIGGHYPARTRIVVSEEDTEPRLGLIYALRSRHYSAAPTAACAFAAQDLIPLDTAANATVASQPVVRHQNLSTAWTPVLGIDAKTHTGTNRLWAVVYSTSGTPPRLRSVYDIGDMVLPEVNDPVEIPGPSNFYLVDLGELHLDRGPVGDHKWAGQIQAQGSAGGENVSILRAYVLNCDEGYGVIRAPLTSDPGLIDYEARDEFNQASGDLTGETLPTGQVWTAPAGGATDDFEIDDTYHWVTRDETADADQDTGRYATAGTDPLTDCVVQADVRMEGLTTIGGGVLARCSDIDNWVRATVSWSGVGTEMVVFARKCVGGTPSALVAGVPIPGTSTDGAAFVTIRLVIVGDRWEVWAAPQGGILKLLKVGTDSDLTGALPAGPAGLYDVDIGTPPLHLRNYDNFLAWEPAFDAVLNADRSLEIRTEGTFREIAAGGDWGPTQPPYGDLPRLPPSGLEDRPCEVFLLASSGDLDELPHAAGDITARVYSRASYLTAPPGPPFPSELTIPSEDLFPGP